MRDIGLRRSQDRRIAIESIQRARIAVEKTLYAETVAETMAFTGNAIKFAAESASADYQKILHDLISILR
jgi:hypothetical protein